MYIKDSDANLCTCGKVLPSDSNAAMHAFLRLYANEYVCVCVCAPVYDVFVCVLHIIQCACVWMSSGTVNACICVCAYACACVSAYACVCLCM